MIIYVVLTYAILFGCVIIYHDNTRLAIKHVGELILKSNIFGRDGVPRDPLSKRNLHQMKSAVPSKNAVSANYKTYMYLLPLNVQFLVNLILW